MKVLHVYQVYRPDDFTGIPRVIWELCESMTELGVTSEVLCLSNAPSNEPIMIGRHVVHQAKRNIRIASASFSIEIFRKFKDLVGRFDVVHYHFPWPQGDLLYLAYGRKTPSVVTYHSDIVKQKTLKRLYAPVQTLFLRMIDRIVATSPNYVDSSVVLSRFNDKITVIPIGLGERVEPDDRDLEAWRAKVGQGFFLFVGALRYYKGLSYLIDAARITGLPVVIAGRGEIDVKILPSNVHYVGEINDADKECLLKLSRAFVFPSHLRSEAFGLALLEAARAGRGMISCEIGTGTTYVNEKNVTGIVIPPHNVEALAEAMIYLYECDEDCEKFGKNALKRFNNLFKVQIMRDLYFLKYLEINKKNN